MSKIRKNTAKSPDPKSNRSVKRNSRLKHIDFRPEEHRKHRRMQERLDISCNINGVRHDPGESVMNRQGQAEFHSGGSRRYH